MDAARSLPAPHADATRSSAPVLPPSQPRPAPRFERRTVEVQLPAPPRERRTSIRAYLIGAVGLVAISVGGWFALGAYIYG